MGEQRPVAAQDPKIDERLRGARWPPAARRRGSAHASGRTSLSCLRSLPPGRGTSGGSRPSEVLKTTKTSIPTEAAIATSRAALRPEIEEIAQRLTLLQAGAIYHPLMRDHAEFRLGRVAAAQLASLALRGHLGFRFGGEFLGPRGLLAVRTPGPPDAPAPEEDSLLRILFGAADTVRIAERGTSLQWEGLAEQVNERTKDAGLGWRSRERYRMLRRLARLRGTMRGYLRAEPDWDDDVELHAAGFPFAVLFNLDGGRFLWPSAPADDREWVPYGLAEACVLATT